MTRKRFNGCPLLQVIGIESMSLRVKNEVSITEDEKWPRPIAT